MPLPASDEVAVTQFLGDYYSAFSTLEVQTVVAYFHEPCLMIGPQGVFAAPARAVLANAFAPVMEGLRARGYARSELSVEYVRPLSATAAIAGGVAVRYKIDGQELERVGVTYVLHKADAGWRIAVLIIHDPGSPVASLELPAAGDGECT